MYSNRIIFNNSLFECDSSCFLFFKVVYGIYLLCFQILLDAKPQGKDLVVIEELGCDESIVDAQANPG